MVGTAIMLTVLLATVFYRPNQGPLQRARAAGDGARHRFGDRAGRHRGTVRLGRVLDAKLDALMSHVVTAGVRHRCRSSTSGWSSMTSADAVRAWSAR